jgi:hypothetical protein
MDVTQPYVFAFNPATATGSFDVTPDPGVVLSIFNLTTSTRAYNSPRLPASTTTSIVLPSNTLQPGDTYEYVLTNYNDVGFSGTPVPYFNSSAHQVYGIFTAASGPGGPQR